MGPGLSGKAYLRGLHPIRVVRSGVGQRLMMLDAGTVKHARTP